MKGKNSLTWREEETHPESSENLSSSSSCLECTRRTDQSICLKAVEFKLYLKTETRLWSFAGSLKTQINHRIQTNGRKEKGVPCLNEY